MLIAKFILVAFIGYLLGSIPFGLILSKYKAKIDIRQYGSGKSEALTFSGRLAKKHFCW